MIEFVDRRLHFSGIDVEKLIRTYPTPFFLFSEETLRQNYQRLVHSFSSEYDFLRVDYSIKTNNEIGILRILHQEGAAGEIVAGYELELAKKAGFSPKKLTFDGPYKTDEEISLGLRHDIHAFYADSVNEFHRINTLAKKMKKTARVGVRVNLGLQSILSGPAETFINKFGIPYADVISALKYAQSLSHLHVIAISTHLGSQITSPDPYLKACDRMIQLARKLKNEGITLSEINLGGGFPSQTLLKTTIPRFLLSRFGIDYTKTPPTIEEYGRKIGRRFRENVKKYGLDRLTMAIQPGRSLSSSMGIALSTVRVVKKDWVFLDISTSSLPESLFFAQRQLLILNPPHGNQRKKYNIAGKGLNSADNFALTASLPKLTVGDIVVILDAGAYSISRANRFTILNPPVYLIDKTKNIILIRRGETYEDILAPMEP